MDLTTTEAAIIDLEKQREAFLARAKNFDPKAIASIEPGDIGLTPDFIEAMTRPVRVEISFEDPYATRQQIQALQACLVEALVVTQDHGRGINRQRIDLRNIVKNAAEVLLYMRGKAPSGKKKPGAK